MPALFARRHYEWLAAFAGETLDEQQCGLLGSKLARDNPGFKPSRFIAACDKARALRRMRSEYGEPAQATK